MIFYIIQGYFDGIVGNLMLLPIYYPGWVMRLYYDLEDGDPITKVRYMRININEFMDQSVRFIEFVYCFYYQNIITLSLIFHRSYVI